MSIEHLKSFYRNACALGSETLKQVAIDEIMKTEPTVAVFPYQPIAPSTAPSAAQKANTNNVIKFRRRRKRRKPNDNG